MQRERRLRRSADFSAVYRRGRSVSDGLLTVRALRTGGPRTRFGFSVGKRVGKAVVRNRVKRRLRAAAAALPVVEGWDVVITARANAASGDFAALQRALVGLLRRSRLLTAGGPQQAAADGSHSDGSSKDGRGRPCETRGEVDG